MTHTRIYQRIRQIVVLMLLPILFTSSSQGQTQGEKAQRVVDGFRVIEWTDLMPKDDLDALLHPPESLNDIADGSMEDQISSQIQGTIAKANDSRYQRALLSTRIVPEYDGQKIRLPGFIVPLEVSDDQTITSFFLVPYFGACIHVPPPPPNQIIYAEYDKGFKLDALYDPFWISGTLSTKLIENNMATAAYTIKVDRVEPYVEK